MASSRFPRARLRGGPPGHPILYEKRVASVDRGAQSGDVVEVTTKEGRPVGYAFLHRESLVTLRMLTRDPGRPPDQDWLRERLALAAGLRSDVLRLGEVTNAWRVVHAEGDGLGGLVVDRYGPVAVVSLFSLGWAQRRAEVAEALAEVLDVDEVIFRVDARTAEQEHIDLPELEELAAKAGGTASILVDTQIGRFVLPGAPLCRLTEGDLDTVSVRDCFTLGDTRTFDQDVRFGVIVLAEIAQRALSPAVNDPGTAIFILDRITRMIVGPGDTTP